jgi:hypothetical protein
VGGSCAGSKGSSILLRSFGGSRGRNMNDGIKSAILRPVMLVI